MINNEVTEQLKEVLHRSVADGEIAGANLLVLKDGSEICYLEDGFADIEAGKEIRRDQIFSLYSMTKPITAAAVMILLERGLLDLSEPVSRYLPSFTGQMVEKDGVPRQAEKEMRIVNLLSMTSGLLYDDPSSLAGRGVSAVFAEIKDRLYSDDPMTTLDVAEALGKCALAFEPGTSWRYGASADVLGALVEVISGKTFGEFLRTEIFAPLGMEDTGFYVPPEKQGRLARVYEEDGCGGFGLYTGNHLGILNPMDRVPLFESGGAGLFSTIDDYSRFASMLLDGGVYEGKRILKPRTVAYLTSARLNEAQKRGFDEWVGLEGYSYGNLMRVMQDSGQACMMGINGEYGWDGWLGLYFANHPSEKLTILLMMQKTNGFTPLTRKLKNLIIGSLE